MLAIEAQKLSKTYRGLFQRGGQQALAGLDLAIPRGTAFGLIGQNGAGKTTFIKTILGVVRPTSGVVRALGGSPEDPKIRARIGYLPARVHLRLWFTPPAYHDRWVRVKGVTSFEGVTRRERARGAP